VPDVTFSEWIAGLPVDTLTGPEKVPVLDGTTSRHVTATLLAAFVVDTLHQAPVITTVADADELNVFQSDIECQSIAWSTGTATTSTICVCTAKRMCQSIAWSTGTATQASQMPSRLALAS